MWRKTAAGMVVADAVSFGTDDLAVTTRSQFAAIAFPGFAVPLLPPVPNVVFAPPVGAVAGFVAAGAAGWRRVERPLVYPPPPPPPGHAATIHIPAADIVYNIWNPAAGAFAAVPAGLPDAVLDLWGIANAL
jgi:hypothetical protein